MSNVCPHGQLDRVCEVCELTRERDALSARVERAEHALATERGKLEAADAENDRLVAKVAELEAALRWCGDHAYAGGRGFKDVEPVKSALADEAKHGG